MRYKCYYIDYERVGIWGDEFLAQGVGAGSGGGAGAAVRRGAVFGL